MDASEAAKLARKHFEAVHGQYGALAFRAESARPNDQGGWILVCSFFAGMVNAERVRYEIEVRDDGSIGPFSTLPSQVDLPAR